MQWPGRCFMLVAYVFMEAVAMTLQQIRYFTTAAQCGSISAAARKLFVAQSSISEAVKEIEKTYGITAFTRQRRGVSLTRDGEDLMMELLSIQQHLEFLDEKFVLRQKRQEMLCIASQHHICGVDSFVAFLSRTEAASYWMEFLECGTEQVLSNVEDGIADLGILFYSLDVERQMERDLKKRHLVFHPLAEGLSHAYLGRNHPLAGQPDVSTGELTAYPLISYDRRTGGNGAYTDIVLFDRYQKIVTVADRATAYAIMQGSYAFTVGSGFCSLLDPDQILCKPIRDGKPIRIGWLSSQQKTLSDNARRYAALLEQQINSRKMG